MDPKIAHPPSFSALPHDDKIAKQSDIVAISMPLPSNDENTSLCTFQWQCLLPFAVFKAFQILKPFLIIVNFKLLEIVC